LLTSKGFQEDLEWYWGHVEELENKAQSPESDDDDAPLTIGTNKVSTVE
jgi:hypothetical protein